MVCNRCIMAVSSLVEKLSISAQSVKLGELELTSPLPDSKLKILESELNALGFELINNRIQVIIDKIKNVVLHYTDLLENENRENLSSFIISRIPYDYSYLSNLFSSVEGITIEHFFILQRIEKAKEYLVYDQHSLTEISFKLGYSSVHHLSSQFKKITGLTPSHFKKIGSERRKPLDKI